MRAVMALIVLMLASPAVAAEPFRTVVFDLELIDMSQEADAGIRDDQTRRLQRVSDELRELLRSSPQIQLIDWTDKIDEVRQKSPLHNCNGCAEDLAKELGADLLVSGIVQKTSNLILSFAITIKDVRSGKPIRGGQADIRGNTDDSWLRGIRWVAKNRLLSEPLSVQP
ncbi:DUF3280 domain-containing protein [Microvirga pakistanensis]|uniref:DUF3280 domain-containing protein n=1 Tax=Microvirga pakistanensis TaxID=1682650 RepID=UPI00141B86BF|nr:DUF3280 domain-containing protein [Microvirga pakistanensis]